MKIDAEIYETSPAEVPQLSKKAEEYGFDGMWVNETKHDPFIQLTLAASNTKSISIGSAIALAFTRSPTSVAYSAWDLQGLSGGRLILGLGSQVKGHIERRFGMKWDAPAPKMKEVVMAIKAVWKSWQNGSRLDFRGKYFRLDLMTPFFTPGPIRNPEIPVYIAGVNRGMCRVVGEVGDGLHLHPLHTIRYLKEVLLPALSRGLATSKRDRAKVSVAVSVFAAAGEDDAQIRRVKEFYRNQVAFYASTRTYRKVMELHGWGDVSDKLHEHSVKGEWDKMPQEVTDDVLREFVVEGTWGEIGKEVRRRYDGLADRARFYLPFDGGESWKSVIGSFRA